MRPRSVVTALLFALAACGGARADEPAPAPGSAGAGGAAPSDACDASSAAEVAVASDDLDGYPPYAVAGCVLAYVSRDGDLRLRDLGSRAETQLAARAEAPRRPAVSIDERGAPVIAWEATLGGRGVVRVRSSADTKTIEGAFASASEPRVHGARVVFTAHAGPAPVDDTDVWLFDARAGTARLVLGGPGQQRFADVSDTHVAATDFSEDPDGRYDGAGDLADVVVYEIATGATTRRSAPGKQAFPMLGADGVLAYLEWILVRPEPKLDAYDLRAGLVGADPTTDRTIAHVEYRSGDPVRPALSGGALEWIANPDGATTLYRAAADGSSAPVRVAGLDGLHLHAPAPSEPGQRRPGFTLLAAVRPDDTAGVPVLRGVLR